MGEGIGKRKEGRRKGGGRGMEEGDESQRELSDGTNRAMHHVQQFQHSDSICRCDIPSSSFS